MSSIGSFVVSSMQFFALLLVFAAGVLIAMLIVFYIRDITQTENTIRRNYPVVGRFRYLFEHLGEFFRQYFFSQDREEMPFNRAERSWVYRAAKGVDNTVALGCIEAMQCNKNTCPTGIATHEKKLQRGLHVSKKSERVARYINQMVHEIGVISHSAGVNEPRKLGRKHARIMGENGISTELTSLYPYPNYHLNRDKMAARLAAAE